MSLSLKAIVVVAAVIAFLAVAYYFVIALPAQNKAKVQFERDKFEQELKEKSAKEQEERQKENQRAFEKQNAQTRYESCLLDADDHYILSPVLSPASWRRKRNCKSRLILDTTPSICLAT